MYRLTFKKLLLLIFLLVPNYVTAASLGELRLSLIEGDVQIMTADTKEWSAAVINFPLKAGDQIWVPDNGRAEVKSRRGNIIRLDEKSSLDILTVEKDALQFYLSMGLAYVNASGEKDTTLQMDTPLSSVRVYKRAKFSADVPNEQLTTLSIYLGEIIAEGRKGNTTVSAGELLSIDQYSTELSTLGKIDSWERWNGDLDRLLEEQQKSLSYLPEELSGYANDFDRNGEWVSMPEYGYVWRPTVQVSSGWSPYRHGRWVWVASDYVWVAQEPWGWAPYHYGRWSFITRYGWCWVPPARHEAYWGPGYVGWVRTPTYISWVPLAPREIYYGHGNYGPHSVDLNHVDVRHVKVKNVYRNVNVENSVTTVHHDTFVRGKHVDIKVKENPFLKEKISVGRPQIQPERETKSAGIREIPPTRQPPEAIRNVDVEKLQERHHLRKNRHSPTARAEKVPQQTNAESQQRPQAEQQEQQATAAKQELQPTKEHVMLTPQGVTQPPQASVREKERRPPPFEGRDRQAAANEVTNRQDRQESAPLPQHEASVSPAAEHERLMPRASPPPSELIQDERQPPPERQTPREEIDKQPNHQEMLPPVRQEAVAPAIEHAAPSQHAQNPVAESKWEESERQAPSNNTSSRQGSQETAPLPQREEPPPPAVDREPPPLLSYPPAEHRGHAERREPSFDANDRQPSNEEIGEQINRHTMQPPARQEVPPAAIEHAVQAPQASAPPPIPEAEAPLPETRDGRATRKNRHKKNEGADENELPSDPGMPPPEQTENM